MAIFHAIFTKQLSIVLRDIALNVQTGLLSIEHVGERGIEKGEIFFEEGESVFARTEREFGEAALTCMRNWRQVYYTFFDGVQAPVRNRNLAGESKRRTFLTSLLLPSPERHTPAVGLPKVSKSTKLERAQLADIKTTLLPRTTTSPLPQIDEKVSPDTIGEFGGTRATTRILSQPLSTPDAINRIPTGVYAIFRSLPAARTKSLMNSLDRRDRTVFMLLDGKRTVHDIALLLHRTEPDVAHTLVRLLKRSYIEHAGS